MKKLFTLLLTLLMILTLAACGKDTEVDNGDSAESDLQTVIAKGKLVVGITNYEPMDYLDENGEWIGFDADMARTFAKTLGVEAEFVEIDWDNKIFEVESGSIDCIWNGMTITQEITASLDCTNPYSKNAQVIVVKDATKYPTIESLNGAIISVEAGSAGELELDALDIEIDKVALQTQANALTEVFYNTADACVIDYSMANTLTGVGKTYEGLTVIADLNAEEYGVAFRKGSDIVEKLNEFFISSYADGSLMAIATTYGIENEIIAQK